jgi:hypothetical protein
MSVEFCKRTKRSRHSGGNAASPWIASYTAIALNTALQYPLLTMPVNTSANDSPPSVGKMHVCSMEFGFWLQPQACPPFNQQLVYTAFGVYRSSWDTRTGTWAMMSPFSPLLGTPDANRGEWFDLQAEFYILGNSETIYQSPQPIRYKADFHIDETLSRGRYFLWSLLRDPCIPPSDI